MALIPAKLSFKHLFYSKQNWTTAQPQIYFENTLLSVTRSCGYLTSIIIIITFIKITVTADGSSIRCGWLRKMASCHYTCATMLLWYSVCNRRSTVTIIILMMKALFMTAFVFCRPLLNECHLSVFVLIFQAWMMCIFVLYNSLYF